MLSPTPVSLFCALLLCLPLAIVFTVTTPPTTNSASGGAPTVAAPTIHKISVDPVPTLLPAIRFRHMATIFPPRRPPYSPEDDDSLFQLAAQVDPNPPVLKKLAFLFLTTTPLPFAPLWELYFNQTPKYLYNIYIHADPSFEYDPPFQGVFAHRVIPSKPTYRHSPTLISAARRLISHALLHDPSNYMFAILSPSCVPLRSFNFTHKTLITSNKSFIEILGHEVGAYDRWAARGEDAMVPEVEFEDFRIGSQFFVLTRRHARVVVSDGRVWSKFKLPCLHQTTCYPEEHYFATLLSMVDPRGCVPATLTHVDWKGRHDGHPRTYHSYEVGPNLIKRLRRARPRYGDENTNGSDLSVTKRSCPFLFARKFSADSILPLLRIANDFIFKD